METAVISLENKMPQVQSHIFNSRWDSESQKMHFGVSEICDTPLLVSVREYKSNGVLWSAIYNSLHPGIDYWIMPISKSVCDYTNSSFHAGVKICIYNALTNKQLYEMPYFNKFIDVPYVDLSNSVPYHINYLEFFVQEKYAKYMKPFDTVVDVGANIGVFTSYLLHKKIAKKIIAIECGRAAFSDLKNNFYTNPIVTLINKALHINNSRLEFYEDCSNPTISSAIHRGNMKYHNSNIQLSNIATNLVDTITIADIINQHGIIDLFKIDIEGGEYSIFESVESNLLSNINNFLIECHFFEEDYLSKYNSLISKLNKNGFAVEEFKKGQSEAKGGSEMIFATKISK